MGNIDFNRLNGPQSKILRETLTGIDADSQRFADGKGLEKMVRDAGFADLIQWTDQLLEAGRRVCRISYQVPHGMVRGTGFLVASDLVLTNYHVVEDVLRGKAESDRVRLSFDYAETADGLSTGDKFWLAEDWIVGHAPYGDADLATDTGKPKVDELDFALLRLDKPAGETEGPAGKRGWFNLEDAPEPTRNGAIVFVLQHPEGKPLKQSIGLLQKSETHLRLRYDADTAAGSSGGLVLDQRLRPLALHHGGDPGSKIKFNQGIPLTLIRAALDSGPPRILRAPPTVEHAAQAARDGDQLVEQEAAPGPPRVKKTSDPSADTTERTVNSDPGAIRHAGPPLLFYSYARDDEALRDQLAKHFKLLERQGKLRSWYDGNIESGDEDQEIKRKLQEADIILLLASPDYLISDDIWRREELKAALKRHERGEARVIPIILRPINLEDTQFRHLMPLPRDRRAITTRSGADRDQAFVDIARAIGEIAAKISAESS